MSEAGRKHIFPLAEGGTHSTFNLHRISEDSAGIVACDGVNHYRIYESGYITRLRSCGEGCVFFGLRRIRRGV